MRLRPALALCIVLLISHGAHAAQIVIGPGSVAAIAPPAESEEAVRYLMALPLPAALNGATIDFARLLVGISSEVNEEAPAGTPFIIDVYALETQWSAGSVSWSGGWDSPGGDYLDDTHSSYMAAADTAATVSLDLTHVVQAWVDGELDNCGVILKVPTGTCCGITAIEESDPAPALVVYYTPAED